MPQLSFFIGKGGVGKTTVSAAYAVRAARGAGKPVLLVSTDPAHSLGDVFSLSEAEERRLSQPQKIAAAPANLRVWQIDAAHEFEKFLSKYRDEILDLVESGTIFSREEMAPLLSTTLPGMAEIAALVAIHEAVDSGKYGEIVVDTAPMGHTLRLFEMPQHFARFLDFLDVAGGRDRLLAQHFGGTKMVSHQFLGAWRQMIHTVEEAMARSGQSRIVLVTTPETFSLNEALRSSVALAEGASHLRITNVILNRAVTSADANCAFCRERQRNTISAAKFLKRHFAGARLRVAADSGAPILGAKGLARFGVHIFDGKPVPPPASAPRSAAVGFTRARWPELVVPLAFTLGKGGVGKTTVSSATALHEAEAHSTRRMTICSTDPAPSLGDIFGQKLGSSPVPVLRKKNLVAAEFDAVAEFRAWAEGMRAKIESSFSAETRGIHVDLAFERQVFSALLDVVPPGVDELFAIFRILDLVAPAQSQKSQVIIDMAPTGHALELLRMPERMLHWSRLLLKILARHRDLALAQDVAVEVASIGQRVRELAAMLKSPARAAVIPVMLAEPLPDRETGRLLNDLRELGAKPAVLFVNRLLIGRAVEHCRRCRIAQQWQNATLNGLGQRLGFRGELMLVPNFPREVKGRDGLQSLTRELWQPAKPLRDRAPARKHRRRRSPRR